MHQSSAEVRGIDGASRRRRWLRGAASVAMGVIGAGALVAQVAGDSLSGVSWFFAVLLVIAVAGLADVVHEARHVRRRPGAVLGTAPSGLGATVVPRSRFGTVASIAVTGSLATLAAAGAVAAGLAGSPLALLPAVVALVLAWPLVQAARGRVAVGGLYLTPAGIEHRRDAVSWALTWDQVAGAAPREPMAIVLQPGVVVDVQRTTRWMWNREIRAPAGVVGVSCRDLGLDAVLVAAAIGTALTEPERRAELGTPASLAWPVLGG